MKKTVPDLDQIAAAVASGEADIEAGRVVPGEVVADRIRSALAQYEAKQQGGHSPQVARRR